MKVKVELDSNLSEPEVVIRAPKIDDSITTLVAQLEQHNVGDRQLAFFKGDSEYFLELDALLFFETDERAVMAHTVNDAFASKLKLYELEELLPPNFVRISKSTIVNVQQIFALTRTFSNVLVEFQNTHKQVYASRRYAKILRDTLNQKR